MQKAWHILHELFTTLGMRFSILKMRIMALGTAPLGSPDWAVPSGTVKCAAAINDYSAIASYSISILKTLGGHIEFRLRARPYRRAQASKNHDATRPYMIQRLDLHVQVYGALSHRPCAECSRVCVSQSRQNSMNERTLV